MYFCFVGEEHISSFSDTVSKSENGMWQVVIARVCRWGRAQTWSCDSLMLEMQAIPAVQSVV